MKLSAPIHVLKRKARLLSRRENIPLHRALDRIAATEGYRSWSLLVARMATSPVPVEDVYGRLAPGDLVLVGGRPGQGKTLMSLKLVVSAMRSGHKGMLFSLEYTEQDVQDRFRALGVARSQFEDLFAFDGSDAIRADHIMARLESAPSGTLAVIDYLQILDQKRDTPELMVQVGQLRAFARAKGHILVFISQIDRSFDPAVKDCPDAGDVRLPNPLDLALFDKSVFVHGGRVQFRAAS